MFEREKLPNQDDQIVNEPKKKRVRKKERLEPVRKRKPISSNLPEQILSQMDEAELRGKGRFPD